MVKEFIKSPKPKPKFSPRSSKNGYKSAYFERLSNGKMGVNKPYAKEKKHNASNPVKSSSFKKKFEGNKREKFEQNGENTVMFDRRVTNRKPRDEKEQNAMNPEKNSSFESAQKSKFGDYDEKKKKFGKRSQNTFGVDRKFGGEKRQNSMSSEKFEGAEKSKFGDYDEKKKKFGKKSQNTFGVDSKFGGEKRQHSMSSEKFEGAQKSKFGDEKQKFGKKSNFRGENREDLMSSEKGSSFENSKKKKMEGDVKRTFKVSSLKTAKRDVRKGKFEEDVGAALLVKRKGSKKTSIRIDPYDTSNKRLDDGIVLSDLTNQQKKKEEEKGEKPDKVELSRNAQFRAIVPSPSILTFVQENLLGRRRDIELRRAGYNTELSAPLDNIPFSTKSDRERIEESLFRNKLEFFAAAKVSSSFPPPDLPEIAFAGRSNVGKSSLLNALTRQWGVVWTSDKPGHTQTINFFKLGTKLNMVDLPGYGFAYAKDEVKEAWEELVKEYVSQRVGLKRVCLLIDTKWGMKPRDIELIHLMEKSQTKYQIVLTKTDVVFPLDVARRAMEIEETLKAHKSAVQPVMMVSSKSGAGIRYLRTALSKIARFVKP